MNASMIGPREVTAALRGLYPAPVRLSTRAADPGYLVVRLPERPARDLAAGGFGAAYLSRRLGVPVTVAATRTVRRRDFGRDVDLTLHLGG